MKTLAAMAAVFFAVASAGWSPANAQAQNKPKVCEKPRQMEGFKTCADVDKAEAEGAFTLYSTDPEQGQVKLLAAFNKMFPKIKTSYVRLQAGALYAKVLSERQAKSYLVDVIQISDMGMILDFQRKGGFRQYVSPEMQFFPKEAKSQPEGFWTWGSVIMAGIAYNPNQVSAADAPKPGMIGFKPASEQAQRALEAKFDAQLNANDLRAWMERMSSAPNHLGSAHDKANADFILAKFKEAGWDARIETFYVAYPTPKTVSVEMVAPTSHKATLTEGPVPGDRTSTQVADELPAYTAFGGDGDITADVVYVNQGMPADYEMLARNGIDVKGKIVVARYGGGWRGLKPKLAQEHGAAGCIIYSDPADDGYGTDDTWPKGAARPPQGVQRGSVLDLPVRPGDPLTPNIGATKDAKRLTKETAENVLKIPVLPISYGDAQPILAALAGPVAPGNWRGGLPITYHMGGTGAVAGWPVARAANHVSTPSSQARSRMRKFSWLMRWLRVSSE